MREDTATEPVPPGPGAGQSYVALALRNDRTVGSLQLVLARTPRPEDERIADVVMTGVLALELVVTSSRPGAFIQAAARLLWQGQPVGQRFIASGVETRVGMSCVLPREAALAAGEAIAGNSSALVVEITTTDMRSGAETVQQLPLHALFAARLIQSTFDVHLLAPGVDGLEPVPRRLEAATPSPRVDRYPMLAKDGTDIVAVNAFADPRSAQRLRVTGQPDVDPIPDLHDDELTGSDESGPLVDNTLATSWPDSIDPKLRWYCPAFDVALPAHGQPFATSPFQFLMARASVSSAGAPARTVKLRLELVPRLPDGLTAATGIELRAIEPTSVAIAIELPFVDQRTGQPTIDTMECEVTQKDGHWVATCELANDWVRVCYRALSSRDPNDAPLRVRARIAFVGLSRPGTRLILTSGGKTAKLPVKRGTVPIDGPHLDAATRTVNAGSVALYLPLEHGRMDAGPAATVRPAILQAADIGALPGGTLTIARTVVCARSASVRAPCNEYGEYYVEHKDIGDVAIGCSSELAVESIAFTAYEEISQLASPAFRVFRSLQRPNRALVLPTRMRVSRHPPDSGERAYRPALVVYCTLDPDVADNARVLFDATFEPDLTVADRRRLLADLRAYMADPVLEYPSSVTTSDTFHWAVDRNANVVVEAFPFDAQMVHATFGTDVAGALLVRSMIEHGGILGTWELTLSDGQSLRTSLVLDLEAFAGPWEDGPLSLTRNGSSIRIVNKIEAPIDITGLLVERGKQLEQVSAARRLGPGQATDIVVNGAFEQASPTYRVAPITGVALEEIRSFIEDVRINIVFVDQLDHVARGIAHLEVIARIVGVEPTRQAIVGDDCVAELEFLLPLTTYLAGRVVEFAVIVTPLSGAVTQTSWHRQDLARDGNVVGITPNLLS